MNFEKDWRNYAPILFLLIIAQSCDIKKNLIVFDYSLKNQKLHK